MTKFTSLIPPDIPIPEPPDPTKIIGAILSALLSLLFVAFIVFVCFEFVMDQIGRPIRQEFPPPADAEKRRPIKKRIFTAEEIQAQFHVVSPPTRSLIEGKNVSVLCRWKSPGPEVDQPPIIPQLLVDETPVPWTVTFGESTWLARFELEIGEHQLRVLGQDVDIFVHDKAVGIANIWKPLIIHEGCDDPNRCGECHVMIEGKNDLVRKNHGLTVGPLLPVESCFKCHETAEVDRRHSKLAERPNNDCSNCHGLHGNGVEPKAESKKQ